MNEITDQAVIRALGRQLNLAVAKQVVSASNLANLDTPGYRAKEVAFDEILAGEVQKLPLAGSSPGHLSGGSEDGRVREAEGLQSRRDGNNVQLDRELLQMTRAAGDFATAQTVLSAKFRLIRYAINEGR